MSVDDDLLVRAYERKLVQAIHLLSRARDDVVAVAAARPESSRALAEQAAQAQRRSAALGAETAQLVRRAERLVAEAGAIRSERTI